MKGVILEKKGIHAAVLCSDGTVRNLRTNGSVGQEIEVQERNRTRSIRMWGYSAVAAVCAVTVSLGSYTYLYAQPVSYVSVNAVPSIEYAVNRKGRIISCSALNSDGEDVKAVLDKEDLKGTTVAAALKKTEKVLTDLGYVSSGDLMMVNVASNSSKALKTLTEEVSAAIGQSGNASVTITSSTLGGKKSKEEEAEAAVKADAEKKARTAEENTQKPETGNQTENAQSAAENADTPAAAGKNASENTNKSGKTTTVPEKNTEETPSGGTTAQTAGNTEAGTEAGRSVEPADEKPASGNASAAAGTEPGGSSVGDDSSGKAGEPADSGSSIKRPDAGTAQEENGTETAPEGTEAINQNK